MGILNAMPPYNLFGLEEQDYKKAKVVVFPIPYDSTSTYKVGSREGPRAIIEASRSMELYSEELNRRISDIGIYTMEEMAPDFDSPKGMVDRIAKEVSLALDDSKVPLLIGGEHTIAIGAVKAIAGKYKDFSVLHFDAHADSYDEFHNSRYCHACVMARIREICKSCYSVGVRSIDEKSAKKLNDILYMKEARKLSARLIAEKILKSTTKNLYVTIDLDVLDSAEMPSTGTPEPGGFRYNELKDILEIVLKQRKLIGMDVNELCPLPGMVAPNYLAAKLIYQALGYAFLSRK
ncbi:MAG: agmatinase [Candidatus Marsarchaeota archaeon]|jgi:agmatinase|nr:agmatinase [Candidatus Marsarchaeota archaeon]MCL5111506.1 agmatinase [Candidatus Marsarchaeota archaeon]